MPSALPGQRDSVDWTTPADIRGQVQRLWDRGTLLSARVRGEALFPLRLRFRGPSGTEVGARFDEVRHWIRALDESARPVHGYGYELEWRDVNHRQLGRNRLPDGAVVPSEQDALRLIQKVRDADRFAEATELTRRTCPGLVDFIARRPARVLEHLPHWAQLVAVVAWFQAHPRPGLYMRQLDIPGVDTKLVETHRGVLSELLDAALPADALEPSFTGHRNFDQRYGLRSKPPLVRFRILDERLEISGLTDLSVPAHELARLPLPVRRVFITENEVNGLAFPQVPESLVIFGLGYGLERLHEIGWLREREIAYWGDIDTHGFAILDRLRAIFPEAHSFLMDRETLLAHRALWGREQTQERHLVPLERLTADERSVFEDLRHNRLGENVRLEQERISFSHVERALACMTA